ncbi:15796_t:CDS:2 [Rhizophagus irregularis]|nr:15796_t:CDS:2 [Rhizophagus irregularis]
MGIFGVDPQKFYVEYMEILENRLIEDTDLNLDNKKNAWNSIIKIFKEERGQILEISKKRINNSDNRSEDEVDLDIKLKKFNKLEQQIRIINKIVGIVNLY